MSIRGAWFPEQPVGRLAFATARLDAEGLRFLDVGNIGAGFSSHERLWEQVEGEGGWAVACDADQAAAAGTGRPRQVEGDATALPFADTIFDAVYLGGVIEHLWEPKGRLEEIRRVLRPHGLLVLDTPNWP